MNPGFRRPLVGWRRVVVRAGVGSPVNLLGWLAALALVCAPTLSRLVFSPTWPPGAVVLGAALLIEGGTVQLVVAPRREVCSASGLFRGDGGGRHGLLEHCGHCLLAGSAGSPPAELGVVRRLVPYGPITAIADRAEPMGEFIWRLGQPRAPPPPVA